MTKLNLRLRRCDNCDEDPKVVVMPGGGTVITCSWFPCSNKNRGKHSIYFGNSPEEAVELWNQDNRKSKWAGRTVAG